MRINWERLPYNLLDFQAYTPWDIWAPQNPHIARYPFCNYRDAGNVSLCDSCVFWDMTKKSLHLPHYRSISIVILATRKRSCGMICTGLIFVGVEVCFKSIHFIERHLVHLIPYWCQRIYGNVSQKQINWLIWRTRGNIVGCHTWHWLSTVIEIDDQCIKGQNQNRKWFGSVAERCCTE